MSILLVTFILGGFFVFFGVPWEDKSGKELLALLGRLGVGAFTLLLVVITVYLLFKIIKETLELRMNFAVDPRESGFELHWI